MKNSFVLYTNYNEILQDLTMEEMGYIFKAILEYEATGKIIELPKGLLITFRFIKNQLDMDEMKYATKIEKLKANGLKGGRPKKEETKNQKANGFFENHNVNVNDNVYVNDNNINNKKESIKEKRKVVKATHAPKECQSLVVQNKAITPQGKMCEYFMSRYEAITGKKYLATGKDYILLVKLIKDFGEAEVKQRIDWLEIGCVNSVFWFAKNKNDFNIATLSVHWNRIIPQLTEEQKKQEAKRRQEIENEQRVKAELIKHGMKFEEEGGQNVIN